MPLSDRDLAAVRAFCEQRVGEDLRDEMRLEVEEDRGAMVIIERRAPWDPGRASEWSRTPVARLRFTASRGEWSLFRPDTADGWQRYEGLGPVREIRYALAEIERDPMGYFWG